MNNILTGVARILFGAILASSTPWLAAAAATQKAQAPHVFALKCAVPRAGCAESVCAGVGPCGAKERQGRLYYHGRRTAR